MADDEGAAFWEGVYGQPINTYSPYYAKETGEGGGGDGNRVQDDENGLSRMTDEEYVSYVRSKMWEKSHGYILEERMKREEERKRRIEAEKVARRRDRDAYARIWNADDNTLRHNRKITRDSKGMDIRESTSWKISWQNYLKAWDRLREEMDGKHHNNNDNNDNKNNNNDPTTPTSQPQSQKPTPIPIPIQHLIPWPVKTQNIKDVNQGSIEEFLKNAPLTHIPLTNANVPLSKSVPSESKSEKQDAENLNLTSLLKSERIRWHPDKIQQRYGMYGYGIDGETMSVVTGVFQVLDRMLGERR
ncbi:hypothetical protein MMC09_002631 [Bachmanniomyces sp. S44760]|nr:hypothetical protein [Bachmanniomyces sp. S44760]